MNFIGWLLSGLFLGFLSGWLVRWLLDRFVWKNQFQQLKKENTELKVRLQELEAKLDKKRKKKKKKKKKESAQPAKLVLSRSWPVIRVKKSKKSKKTENPAADAEKE